MLTESTIDPFYIRHAIDKSPDYRYYKMHLHNACEIFYFLQGDADYLVEGTKYPLAPGSIVIMRPSESHSTKLNSASLYERYALNFSLSILDSIDYQHRLLKAFTNRPLGRGNLFTAEELSNAELTHIFHEMCYCNGDDYEKKLKLTTGLFRLLDIINNAYLKKSEETYLPPQNTAEQMVAYVNANLTETITIPKLAEHFFLSTSQYTRLFKQATGAAPWEYITRKRLILAKEKIRNGISAQNACDTCGFGDYSSFYRAYTRYYGCAPTMER